MKLSCTKKGKNYRIIGIYASANAARRMRALGMTDGEAVRVFERNLSGSMIIKVRSVRLAVGKDFCERISVEEEI